MSTTTHNGQWHKSACILCSVNCGIEIEVEDRRFNRIRGNKEHVTSEGYTCQKAMRLDYYQNGRSRLTSPLRRKPDGTFEEISWDTAVQEIAARLVELRDTHGGHTLSYYGGGGQGNHLGGAYGSSLRAAMNTRYIYNALAQEKTGGFWVVGKQTCHPAEDVAGADFVLIIGANPWQSHGLPRARKILQDIAKDPNRKLVVVDPRRTETAEKADVFLQVRPGGDAHMLLAMLGTIVQEGLENKEFIEAHTAGYDELASILRDVPVDDYARESGLDPETVRQVAREYAQAEKACVRTDLGLEHSPHSTLNVYLAKLLFLITGHLGKPGTNVFHSSFAPIIKHSADPEEGGRTTRVTGMREIGALYPPNVLPLEIDTDHPDRIRGLVVESGNPIMTGADTQAYRKAFEKLELLVVIDVAMTETARMADYVLPASSQYEKWECTFFNFEFPHNFFHLRRPVLDPLPGTLPEPEIHRRLVVAMGEFPESLPALSLAARLDRRLPKLKLFPTALAMTLKAKPKLRRYVPLVLHQTLGAALPDGANSAAVLWGACYNFIQQYGAECIKRAGIKDEGAGLAEALFQRVLTSESGTPISVHDFEDTWKFIAHKDGRVHLVIPQLIDELRQLQEPPLTGGYPLILMAGERRSYNANTIYRENDWRKQDADGALKIHPEDADRFGIEEGDTVVCESNRGSVEATVTLSDEMRPGVVSLPHGYGMDEPAEGDSGKLTRHGPAINWMTSSDHCDAIAKTPFHKYVPVRLRVIQPAGEPEAASLAAGN